MEFEPDFKPATPQDLENLAAANFSPEEIEATRQKSVQYLAHAKFSEDEINKFYGVKDPDMSDTKQHVSGNIAAYKAQEAERVTTGIEPQPPKIQPTEADTILEGLEAGWGTGFTGLFMNGKMPDVAVGENSPRAVRIASMIAQFAGDIPAMIAGGVAGGAAGTAVPVVGNIVGTAAGAFAAPAAMRKMLMDQYEKGDISSVGDFADRIVAASWEGMKGGITGAATAVVGGPAGLYMGTAGKLAAEAGVMAIVASALEGHLPDVDDFVDGMIVMGGFHAVGAGTSRIKRIYGETGLRPEQVVELAETNPVLKQDMLSVGDYLPDAVKKFIDPTYTPLTTAEIKAAKQEKIIAARVERVIPEGEAPELTEAFKEMDAKIGDKIKKDGKEYSIDEFHQNWVDRYGSIETLQKEVTGGKDLPAAESPYKLFRMFSDYKSKVKHILEKGTFDFKTQANDGGKGLAQIIEPFKGRYRDLNRFLVAARGLELEGQKRTSGFNAETMKKVVAAGEGEFGAAAKELYAFQERNLKYLADSGRISLETRALFQVMGRKYIPFARLIDPNHEFSGGGRSNSLKRLKGSDLAVQNPILSIVENTEMMFKLAEKNRAAEGMIKFAEKHGLIGEDLTFVKEKTPMIRVDAKPEFNKMMDELTERFDLGNADLHVDKFEVYRAKFQDLKDNQFEVYRDGKREVYTIKDRLLAESIRALDGQPGIQNMAFGLARAVTQWKRVFTTTLPDFIMKNTIRDVLTAGVFSKEGMLKPWEVVVAMGDMFKKTDHFWDYLKSGGANGSFLELSSKYLDKEIFKTARETGFIEGMQNTLLTGADILARVGHMVENAPRLAEFKRTVKGERSGPKLAEGGFAAREITVDFDRMGLKAQALNSIAAFMNAQVQGIDRTGRALKTDYTKAKAGDYAGLATGVTAKGLALLTAPTVALWLSQKDDPRYREIPQWQRDLFWCVVTDDWQPIEGNEADGLPEHMVKDGKMNKGIIYRIPKPMELGLLFATLPERMLEAMATDHPDSMKGLMTTVGEMFIPNWKPDIAIPFVEQATNYNDFTKRPLIPQYLEKQLPAYRYTEYTSETAKALGKILGAIPVAQDTTFASPMVIENYIKSWSGPVGAYALQLSDAALTKSQIIKANEKPAWHLADIPMVKAFMVRNPTTQAESIQRFYDRANKMEQVVNTTRSQRKLGHESDVEWIEKNYGPAFNIVRGTKESLSNVGQFIRNINESDYTPTEKRQLIDGQYYQMIEMSRMGNMQMDQFEEMLKNKEGAK